FSTGRTVVLSNVRALARIAEQSGAAALFEAGEPGSLVTVLTELLADPERCRDLAEAGATWVRAERTWAANARTYEQVYRQAATATVAPTIPAPRSGAETATLVTQDAR
ncbi:glycosyltransferase, partial [Hamadaea sp. NPDC051192]|uniref:glycosyltransferase n=1 Tax=Hamadaea sp. NPDC051192 TaxID=3154940 RepID=UPI00343EC4D9